MKFNINKLTFSKIFFLAFFAVFFAFNLANAQDRNIEETKFEDTKKEENIGDIILHHVGDSHEWHFFTFRETHFTMPLPVILYSDNGLDVFMSGEFHHGKENVTKGANTYQIDSHEHIKELSGKKIYDFSITKNVAALFLSFIILTLVFTSVAGAYKKNQGQAPKGMQSFFEPIIVFIRDEIAKKSIGHKYERYMPYLLTLFFFIWFNNMLGLLPVIGANLTGNIAVTLVLSVLTLIITLATSNKNYWGHILAMPGVPKWVLIILTPVELLGILTKPFSLMIRLFANITAGHIVILSFICLIFIFKNAVVGAAVVPLVVAMNCLEIFVALLQAYVFTLLTAIYFGSSVEEHHHEDEKHSVAH